MPEATVETAVENIQALLKAAAERGLTFDPSTVRIHETGDATAPSLPPLEKMRNVLRSLTGRPLVVAEMSDRDKRLALDAALRAEDPNGFFWIAAVFDETFVYEKDWNDSLSQRGYTEAEGGQVTLSEEIIEVRPVTSFVPAEKEKEPEMELTERITALIANEHSQFTEADTDYLKALSEERLATFEAQAKPAETPPVEPAPEPPPVAAAAPAAEPQTTEEWLKQAPPAIRANLEEGLRIREVQHESLVTAISESDKNPFPVDVLKGKDLAELQNLAALAGIDCDFTAAAGAVESANEGPNSVPEPPKLNLAPAA